MEAASHLAGGFGEPAVQSARAFRACLQALARPGRVQELAGANPPAPLSTAAGTLLLTLVDHATPLFLAPSHDLPAVRSWIAFHCGAPLVAAEAAVFALGTWEALQPCDRFDTGTPDYPDRAATLIVEMAALNPANARLTGPGIEATAAARLPDVAAFRQNRSRFPLGFDCFLTVGTAVAGLPRSTVVEAL
ncbi:MAG: phosphonate C-P lyase system protein PhnH [Defluviimonas sp.]|uniref:phosphonate C-P lyase system protein PhnH n=1 Tax=Albidovulum sp. TaxID=1872424 RepID=UPI001D312CEE|nr:phosphonate C-P lyase system protein PhnH [Paracoccaceae bacterium]MCC0062900.1 phosphonate C-P lyase system protein PhnH [Defluviimonas sp.]